MPGPLASSPRGVTGPTSGRLRRDQHLPPTAGRKAEGRLELAVHMALVGEPRRHRGIGRRGARANECPGVVQSSHRQIAIGRGAQPPSEMSGDLQAVEAGNRLELVGAYGSVMMGIEKGACALDRRRGDSSARPRRGGRIESEQRIGDPIDAWPRGTDLSAGWCWSCRPIFRHCRSPRPAIWSPSSRGRLIAALAERLGIAAFPPPIDPGEDEQFMFYPTRHPMEPDSLWFRRLVNSVAAQL